MGVEMFILFKRFFSYLGFSEYSVHSVLYFRILCKFRVLVYNFPTLEYSVYSTISFPHSVSGPVTPQHEQCVMETVESKVKTIPKIPFSLISVSEALQ